FARDRCRAAGGRDLEEIPRTWWSARPRHRGLSHRGSRLRASRASSHPRSRLLSNLLRAAASVGPRSRLGRSPEGVRAAAGSLGRLSTKRRLASAGELARERPRVVIDALAGESFGAWIPGKVD